MENFGNLGPLVAARRINEARYNEIVATLGLACLGNQLEFANARMGDAMTPGGACGERHSPEFVVVNRPNGVLTKRDLESPVENPATVCDNYQPIF